MNWMMPIIAILLAFYGWSLIVQMAKRREAYDLYSSVLSLLDQLDADGRHAWQNNPVSLDEYTEWKLMSKRANIEQRLGLIWKYYSHPAEPTKITMQQLYNLRILLTAAPDLAPREEPRSVAIHRLTTTMISILLGENYKYINKPLWRPF